MKPTAKQLANVRTFVNSHINQSRREDFDNTTGLWFLAFELASIGVAILQVERFALNFNVGLLNFVISGLLHFSYEWAKRAESVPLRLAVRKILHLYIIALGGAIVTMSFFMGWIVLSAPLLSIKDYALVHLVVMIAMSIPVLRFIQQHTKNLHHSWIDSLVSKGRQRYFRSDETERGREVLLQILEVAVPKGVELTIVLHIFNVSLIMAIIIDEPFHVSFLASFLSMPLLWGFVLVGSIAVLILYYEINKSEPVKLLARYLKDTKL